MLRHVFVILMIMHNYYCVLEDYGGYFFIENYTLNDTDDCELLNQEQYYLNVPNDTSTFVKLECLPKFLDIRQYFPKCCPPNSVYERKYHKCLESNSTNIYDIFGDGYILLRTDLFHCVVILDHVFNISEEKFRIDSSRTLYFRGREYSLGTYCLDKTSEKEQFVVKTCEDVSRCKSNSFRCIKKCCPDGQYYEGSTCKPGHQYGLSIKNITRFEDKSESFDAVLVSERCDRHIDKPHYRISVGKDGTSTVRELGVWKQYEIDETYYCVEYARRFKKYLFLVCTLFDDGIEPYKLILNKITLILSCICLLLTLISYMILRDLKNFIGKIIICYCSCLLIAFSSLIWVQFDHSMERYCDVFAFTVAFFFMAGFSWMTILSYEMWRVLGSMKAEYGNRLNTHRKRFIWYNIIGWSIPLLIMTFTLMDYLYYFLPTPIHITLGYRQCVFENNRSKGMYGYTYHFAVPCGIYLLINFVIFIKTIKYIYQVKNEINHIKTLEHNEKRKKWMILDTDRERLKMMLRIFLVMGVNFLFETISTVLIDFTKNKTLEIIEAVFDAFNGLQGVFIFCIFLLKKKIWKSVKEEILKFSTSSRKSSVATSTTDIMMIHKNHP